jgi:hypothetical protein
MSVKPDSEPTVLAFTAQGPLSPESRDPTYDVEKASADGSTPVGSSLRSGTDLDGEGETSGVWVKLDRWNSKLEDVLGLETVCTGGALAGRDS